MKLCAILVTYYPHVEDTIKNIKRYIPYIDHLIIWENTPKKDLSKHTINLPDYEEKISFMGTGKNEGISYALNKAIENARIKEYTHILTMDQDSYWENFENYKNAVEKYSRNNVIYAPLINKKESRYKGIFITSGMIVPMNVYKIVGKYNEIFKVDGIDYEFCFRCISKGIGHYEVQSSYLLQTFGNPIQKNFLGKKYYSSNYSSNRLYEIVKSKILIVKSYNTPNNFKKDIYRSCIVKTPLKIMLSEKDKLKKIMSIIRGFCAGIFAKPLEINI